MGSFRVVRLEQRNIGFCIKRHAQFKVVKRCNQHHQGLRANDAGLCHDMTAFNLAGLRA